MAVSNFPIRDLFRLTDGATVLALEGISAGQVWNKRVAHICHNGVIRQKIKLGGERVMSRQTAHLSQFAVDTWDNVELTNVEAQSGEWILHLADG